MVDKLNTINQLLLWVCNMILMLLKDLKKLGKTKAYHSILIKITHHGNQMTINIQDIIIIILMVMLISVSHHIHLLVKSNVIISLFHNKFGAGINTTENYHQLTHSQLLMLMKNSFNIWIQLITLLKKNQLKEELKLNTV